MRKYKWGIVFIILGVSVFMSIKDRPVIIPVVGESISSMDGNEIYDSIATKLKHTEKSLYLEKVDDALAKSDSFPHYDFIISIRRNGNIKRYTWNMVSQDSEKKYVMFTVSGDQNKLKVWESGELDTITSSRIPLKRVLVSLQNMPWEELIQSLPDKEVYVFELKDYYDKNDEIRSLSANEFIHVDKRGHLSKITGVVNYMQPSVVFNVSYSNEDGRGVPGRTILFLELRDFR